MNKWKRGLALLLAAAMSLALFSGCGQSGEALSLSVCAGGPPEELDPIYADSTSDRTILVHLYEGLMRRSVSASGEVSVTNGAAQSVSQEENADGTVTCTFQLRGEWSDGRDLRAEDFVYAWQRLADPANDAPEAALLSVVAGYDDVRQTGDVTALQVTAEDAHTLTVVLNGTYSWFLSEVCTAPATVPMRQDLMPAVEAEEDASAGGAETDAEEDRQEEPWWSDVTTLVTNGPYQVSAYTAGESLTLAASDHYHEDLTGPETLTFRFAETAEEGQELYDAGEVDFLADVPEERLAALIGEESPDLTPRAEVWTVLFNCGQDVLSDHLVRRALSLAVDRSAAAAAAGAAALPAEGLVPWSVPESAEADFRTTGGALLDNDPDHRGDVLSEARRLLREAGYLNAEDLGPLEYLYVDEGPAAAVARTLTETWESALGITVTARAVTEEELDAALRDGTFSLAGAELRPMGCDAACYLMPWGSDREENAARYANSAYDTLLGVIAGAADEMARLGCLHDAEVLLLEDAALAPLYSEVTAWELRDGLTGVCRDGRGWFSFASVVRLSA